MFESDFRIQLEDSILVLSFVISHGRSLSKEKCLYRRHFYQNIPSNPCFGLSLRVCFDGSKKIILICNVGKKSAREYPWRTAKFYICSVLFHKEKDFISQRERFYFMFLSNFLLIYCEKVKLAS